MAITMSSASVDQTLRENLLGSSVDSSVSIKGDLPVNGIDVHVPQNENITGATLAGVTAEFATNVTNSIDTYIKNVNTYIDNITTAATSGAFQGTNVSSAISTFTSTVAHLASTYVNRLQEAETSIINSVAKAYVTQDTDMSENLKQDVYKVWDNNPSMGKLADPSDNTQGPTGH